MQHNTTLPPSFVEHSKRDDEGRAAGVTTSCPYSRDFGRGGVKVGISLLTNGSDLSAEVVVAIYKRTWQMETNFKQMKQNFPLRCFYGESANAIRILIWVILIASLLLTIMNA